MEKSTQIKTFICGVALVALASVPPVQAQTSQCVDLSSEEGPPDIVCTFDEDHKTNKYDFGTHAIKFTANVNPGDAFDVEVIFETIDQSELDPRLNPELKPAACIKYAEATSTTLGDCGFYHVVTPPPTNLYSGDVLYKVVWDFPTLDQLHNVRLYRAPFDGLNQNCTQGAPACYTQDVTVAVFAIGDSNSDAGVSGRGTGFSDFEAVDLTSSTSTAARVWIGLKNSDDVGTRFDLKAVVKNGSDIVSFGELLGALGGSSGFNGAKLRTIPLSIPSTPFTKDDIMSLEVFVRNSCVGTTHNSGTARLWFNDGAANSRFDEPGAGTLYLVTPGVALNLSPLSGTGPKKTRDVFVGARDTSCTGTYTPFGTWTGAVP